MAKLALVLNPQQHQSGTDYLCDRTVSHGVDIETGKVFVFPKNNPLKSLPCTYDRRRRQYVMDLQDYRRQTVTDQEKIWAWCDRCQSETGVTHGVLVYKNSAFNVNTKIEHPYWIATAQRFVQDWSNDELTTGSTPEEAIAKLAEALGL